MLGPPLGLAYIGSYLLHAGYEVAAIDLNVSGLNLSRVKMIVEEDEPSLVGISSSTESYPSALKIAECVKSVDKDVKVVMGGPHPTTLPQQVLAEDCVDFVIVGEGEKTMLELSKYILEGKGELKNIKGLGYKVEGKMIKINGRRPSSDPDEFPYPARELFPLELYPLKWTILTSRGGCPFKCPFCAVPVIWPYPKKYRSPEKIFYELKMLIETWDVEYVFFTDDLFTFNRKWVYDLLSFLKKLEYPLKWGCSTRVDLVDEDLLKRMASAGCCTIQYGVESGSQKILDSVKGIKKEQVLKAVQAAKEEGMDVSCSFMIPFPEDTKETLYETKEFMKKVYEVGGRILLSYTVPFPGTYFYEHSKELGIKILTDDWSEFDAKHNIIETAHLSKDEIEELVHAIVEELGLKSSLNIY
jgi:radical SAM superfamily enzyme YgiQ (UPF0313 family)